MKNEGVGTMDVDDVIGAIKDKFKTTGTPAQIPLLKGKKGKANFTAELTETGVKVDNLGTQSFLPWAVFQEAVCLLTRCGGRAKRGDAMNHKLGELELSSNSVEGHIAHVVYGKQEGDTVFRRITPIACILIWAGVCKAGHGELILCRNKPFTQTSQHHFD